ncbi:hypothetical protein [Pectobacterium phage Nepra]|uniref:Uncharacterized protein n=1 Tax=Pectobacterium phage Nepra TaxID=2163635 RepID=A0A2S1GT66_9CAUD|nr:hypothetical protein HWB59_gp36 [Pectobacterium phage Nepra]AWD92590.1 hypothetical protein [Pectobacterium phage Nepra]
MSNRFDGYQAVTQATKIVYVTQAKLDEFKTMKLLGMKEITLISDPTVEATTFINLKGAGVYSVDVQHNWGKRTQTLRFKLK